MYRGSVYLAGPIRLCEDYGEATDWRETATDILEALNIKCYSPMRETDTWRTTWADFSGNGDGSHPSEILHSPAGLTARDRLDVERSDIMLANFLGAEDRASLGTALEFGWADAFGTPVVMVIEPDGNIHNHAMLNRIAGWRVSALMEAMHVIDSVIG